MSLSFIFNLIFAEDQLNILTNNCLKKLLICFFFSFLEWFHRVPFDWFSMTMSDWRLVFFYNTRMWQHSCCWWSCREKWLNNWRGQVPVVDLTGITTGRVAEWLVCFWCASLFEFATKPKLHSTSLIWSVIRHWIRHRQPGNEFYRHGGGSAALIRTAHLQFRPVNE